MKVLLVIYLKGIYMGEADIAAALGWPPKLNLRP